MECCLLFNIVCAIVFTTIILILQQNVAQARPPLNSILCDSLSCKAYNAYGKWANSLPCIAYQIVYHTFKIEIVKEMARMKQKLKVILKLTASSTKCTCLSDSHHGILIGTRDYIHQWIADKKRMTISLDSGVETQQSLHGVASCGLALCTTPLWEGVSIAGLISMGTHGSSFKGRGGVVHDYGIGLRLVVPVIKSKVYAKVLDLIKVDKDLDAAKVPLGSLVVFP
ncbi:hypothetical protein GOP47_0003237 [Adiantum capillus-veneris]|uniref:FAD-binding PCMH-type domain-containing protein n=1 Tax=Adiantum capillus-veneris TaxID=13818 RepID=A0A9D4VCE2_ADICA|nr:hypothetical protein GOP47_0003237 [Adiantum capillus-veneris]